MHECTRAITHPEEDILPAEGADMDAGRRRAISNTRVCCGRDCGAFVKALPAGAAARLLPMGTGPTKQSARSKMVIRTAMSDTVVSFKGAMVVSVDILCL